MLDLLYIHWNVDPVLFHIGPLSIRWYSLLFVSGFIFGYYIFRSFYRREGVNEAYLDPLLYAMLICVVIGARLGHCIFYDPQYYFGSTQGFLEVFQPWKGGLASHGGAIAIVLGIIWYARHYGKRYGFLAGFVSATLATATLSIHGGFMLYNGGLVAGMAALILTPLLKGIKEGADETEEEEEM